MADEENQLVDEGDEDSLFKEMDDDDPLKQEQKELKRIKTELNEYLKKRCDGSTKQKMDDQLKAKLQRQLV